MRSSTTQNKHQGRAEVSIVSHSKGPPISNLRPVSPRLHLHAPTEFKPLLLPSQYYKTTFMSIHYIELFSYVLRQ
jgi:hypothetical protein